MWLAGWNMPSYLPESEPVEFYNWDDARQYLYDELESIVESFDPEIDQLPTSEQRQARYASNELEPININATVNDNDGSHVWYATPDRPYTSGMIGNYVYWITND